MNRKKPSTEKQLPEECTLTVWELSQTVFYC
jgi:hypothetical protein